MLLLSHGFSVSSCSSQAAGPEAKTQCKPWRRRTAWSDQCAGLFFQSGHYGFTNSVGNNQPTSANRHQCHLLCGLAACPESIWTPFVRTVFQLGSSRFSAALFMWQQWPGEFLLIWGWCSSCVRTWVRQTGWHHDLTTAVYSRPGQPLKTSQKLLLVQNMSALVISLLLRLQWLPVFGHNSKCWFWILKPSVWCGTGISEEPLSMSYLVSYDHLRILLSQYYSWMKPDWW